jgi:hypothetical protein
MESNATYKCPRCGGTEIYFAKRQRITGSGGIYGNKARMVKTALCKSCGELADWTADAGDIRRLKKILTLTALGFTALIVLLILVS